MAKRKKPGRVRRPVKARHRGSSRPPARRAKPRRTAKRSGKRPKPVSRKARKAPSKKKPQQARRVALPAKLPRLDRVRRTLDDTIVPTPPSSLNLDRHGSAARTGRAEMEASQRRHGRDMSPGLTGGDVDADFENAYFSGDEAPGGDNPTPDQDVVDDIGRSLGVEYNDAEELKPERKVSDRDKHRWELDPASSEDFRNRD